MTANSSDSPLPRRDPQVVLDSLEELETEEKIAALEALLDSLNQDLSRAQA